MAKSRSKSTVELLKDADDLKIQLKDQLELENSALTNLRHQLQFIYRQVLLDDLDFAIGRKVDIELWNNCFRQFITAKQQKSKDRKNPKRAEAQAALTSFLESSNGFYVLMLQEMCYKFKLKDVPGFADSRTLGLFASDCQVASGNDVSKIPKASSCQYIVQDCLIHLGDIARYRCLVEQAKGYYENAILLGPLNGRPYNQLGIILQTKNEDLLSTFFYLTRSLTVKHAFLGAVANLTTTLTKMSQYEVPEKLLAEKSGPDLNIFEQVFCYFNALVFFSQDIGFAKDAKDYMTTNFLSVFSENSGTVSWKFLVRLVYVLVFNIWSILHSGDSILAKFAVDSRRFDSAELPSVEQGFLSIALDFIFSTFGVFLKKLSVPIEGKALVRSPILPALKILTDWISQNSFVMSFEEFERRDFIWPLLVNVLNSISKASEDLNVNLDEVLNSKPLPEDFEVQGYLPLRESLSKLSLPCNSNGVLKGSDAIKERIRRICLNGEKFCELRPKMMEAVYVNGKLCFETLVTATVDRDEIESRKRFFSKDRVNRGPQKCENKPKSGSSAAQSNFSKNTTTTNGALAQKTSSNKPNFLEKGIEQEVDQPIALNQQSFNSNSLDRNRSNGSKNVTFGVEPPKTIDRTPSPSKNVNVMSDKDFPSLEMNQRIGDRSSFNRQPSFLLPTNTPVIRAPVAQGPRFSSPRMAMSFPGLQMNPNMNHSAASQNQMQEQKDAHSPPGVPRYSQQKREPMVNNFLNMSNSGVIGGGGGVSSNNRGNNSQSESLFPSAVLQPGLFPPFPPPPLPLDAIPNQTRIASNNNNSEDPFMNFAPANVQSNNNAMQPNKPMRMMSNDQFPPFPPNALMNASFQNVPKQQNKNNNIQMNGNQRQNLNGANFANSVSLFANNENSRRMNEGSVSSFQGKNDSHAPPGFDSFFPAFLNNPPPPSQPVGDSRITSDRFPQFMNQSLSRQNSMNQDMNQRSFIANPGKLVRNDSFPGNSGGNFQRQGSNPTSLPSFDPIWSNSPIFAGLNGINNKNPPDLMSLDTQKPLTTNSNMGMQQHMMMNKQNSGSSIAQSLFESANLQNSPSTVQRKNSDSDGNNLLAGLFGNMNTFDRNAANVPGPSFNDFMRSQARQQPNMQNQHAFMNSRFESNG
ncbi:nonsense-mediated mRNA decay factor SMG7-like [Symsagittifera roscoffensis]|uniref:nonsense-mediated mRNA decay factor SMG7-like n=1 Tax=Symsagittifera roscoffensis TaxID=84072 RepID=UPI00307C8C9E